MYTFDAKKVKDDCIEWIKKFFEENGKECNAVIGISGRKDSSVAAFWRSYAKRQSARH